jgi:hypothetical protein
MSNEEIFKALDRIDDVLAKLPRVSRLAGDHPEKEAWDREHTEAWAGFRRVTGDD